ncbi:pseudaminic acid cytidylyltransferase [Aquirufa antheringensis]|uniref:pseudaminic acid cytidylyltransferase n=1 Tax=Aquirufa antheringensis TaxID=2516559 RepID=UPI00208FCD76|nr:pseudaminic acid cytidylyltransferase [Aquirufa antheringensis]USQ03356.1 pseudaminic acid cytidylyltransferase [Aquirufa antheringensis]
MKTLAIIPARGGSKRIPRKNIKDFIGKPIIAYSIEKALSCGLFDEVMVSTDDQEIANVAIKYGATVPFYRSKENSSDFASTIDVLNEVLLKYLELNQTFTHVCCIYPTAPLIRIEHLQEGYKLLQEEEVNSVFPIVSYSFPIWRSLKVDGSNFVTMNWPENMNTRSQDLSLAYHDAGQWYWFKPHKVKSSLYTESSKAVIISELLVQDVDNLTDWILAELKYRFINK